MRIVSISEKLPLFPLTCNQVNNVAVVSRTSSFVKQSFIVSRLTKPVVTVKCGNMVRYEALISGVSTPGFNVHQ
jgi:hypothetical protein